MADWGKPPEDTFQLCHEFQTTDINLNHFKHHKFGLVEEKKSLRQSAGLILIKM